LFPTWKINFCLINSNPLINAHAQYEENLSIHIFHRACVLLIKAFFVGHTFSPDVGLIREEQCQFLGNEEVGLNLTGNGEK
jgi:hypothetical protein